MITCIVEIAVIAALGLPVIAQRVLTGTVVETFPQHYYVDFSKAKVPAEAKDLTDLSKPILVKKEMCKDNK